LGTWGLCMGQLPARSENAVPEISSGAGAEVGCQAGSLRPTRCTLAREDGQRLPAAVLCGPAWFSARRSAVTWSASGSPMPIGTEDDLSSRHCRHSTIHGPSGRWITLGWCGVRTPTSCSSCDAPSPIGTLSVARLSHKARAVAAPTARKQPSRRRSAHAAASLRLHRSRIVGYRETPGQEADP
jgi:hypothetical protein